VHFRIDDFESRLHRFAPRNGGCQRILYIM
jgi:hypothetical protein